MQMLRTANDKRVEHKELKVKKVNFEMYIEDRKDIICI